MYERILAVADRLKIEYIRDFPMSRLTSFQTGGNADVYALPHNAEAVSALVRACRESQTPYYIVGNGSNLLVSDRGVRGVVIRIGAAMSAMTCAQDGKISVGAGASLTALCNFACKHSLSGLEFAYGIPGSAGGAAYMNAGAYGGEMRDVLLSCTHITPEGELGCFDADELQLGYRKSIYSHKNYCILDLTLQLKAGEQTAIRAEMAEKMARRTAKQPLEFPSAGSTFKRPTGNFAGSLIEKCGLKGKQIGGAQVSEKHAGFVINAGGATTADIRMLISEIQKTVYQKTGVQLEPEVEFIGEE